MRKIFTKQLIEANIDKPQFANNLENFINNTGDGEKILEALCGARPIVTKENAEQVWKDVEEKWKEWMKGQNTPVISTQPPLPTPPFHLLLPAIYLTNVHITPSFPESRKSEIEEYIASNLDLSAITSYAEYNNTLNALVESEGFKPLLEGEGTRTHYARIPYFLMLTIDPIDYL